MKGMKKGGRKEKGRNEVRMQGGKEGGRGKTGR